MTNEELRSDRALCDAAAPGPWKIRNLDYSDDDIYVDGPASTVCLSQYIAEEYLSLVKADAAFISAARPRWPLDIAALQEAREENARLRGKPGVPLAENANAQYWRSQAMTARADAEQNNTFRGLYEAERAASDGLRAEIERLRAGIQRIVEAARNARLDMGREIVSAVERAAEEVLKP